MVKQQEELSIIYTIAARVLQGNIVYTAELSTKKDTTLCTFADNMAILAMSKNNNKPTQKLQNHLVEKEN